MKRTDLKLEPNQLNQLLKMNSIPTSLQEKLEHCHSNQAQFVSTNEEELEKILDLLPPPHLASDQEQQLRELLIITLQKMS